MGKGEGEGRVSMRFQLLGLLSSSHTSQSQNLFDKSVIAKSVTFL